MRTLDELGISQTPWHLNSEYPFAVFNAKGYAVCEMCEMTDRDCEPIKRHARLIASAPMLYEALRGLSEIVCDDCKSWYGESREKCRGCPRVKTARAALAAASGESEEGKTK